jgi:serralysin
LGPGAIIFRCLWDGGGNDTIDASNQPKPVRIDLAPGSFSTIGGEIRQSVFVADPRGSTTRTTTTTVNGVTSTLTERGRYVERKRRDNLSIAYGAVIENAIGTALADELRGNAVGNNLDGRGGNDRLVGGRGNDLYVFDTDTLLGRDGLEETADANGGIDTISFRGTSRQSIRLDLAATAVQRVNANLEISLAVAWGFENVNGGDLDDDLRGNGQANVLLGAGGRDLLTGREGKDLLDGGIGKDTLHGGGDADRFRFSTALDRSGACDVITDFSRAQGDRIELDKRVFAQLPGTGNLAAPAFHTGVVAVTAEQRILHNRSAGLLSYDPDGNGTLAPLPLARITPGLVLASSCFVVV